MREFWKGVFLNALIMAMIAGFTIEARKMLEDQNVIRWDVAPRYHKLLTTMFVAFITGLIVYIFFRMVLNPGNIYNKIINSVTMNP